MKISFIQTGGTIDKGYPQKSGAYAFEIAGPAFERLLVKFNPIFEYDVFEFLKKDSQEITSEDRLALKDFIISQTVSKIVITHGTDTMIETAKYLQEIPGKTILLTGAKLPERFIDSDAAFNLGTAIGAVQTLSNGVYLAMEGLVIPAKSAIRNERTGDFGMDLS